MLDIKRIRNDFDQIAEKLARRGVDEKTLHDLKELDFKRRQLLIKSEEAKAERNTALQLSLKLSVIKKMHQSRLLICKNYLPKSKHLMPN